MRIIGGWARSRRLAAPAGDATRPTADRVREAIFSILGPPPEGARVLDLFAGAGGMGLEALSRGAAGAVFVDRAPAAVKCLRANIAALDVGDIAEVLPIDAIRAVNQLGRGEHRFDWVFIDPPYDTELAAAALAAVAGGALLGAEPAIVVEHDRRRELPETTGVLRRTDPRIYGDTAVSFYGRVAA
jgi:16S rRNA (guanine(966)-N(2))-methyltransferase RsmD